MNANEHEEIIPNLNFQAPEKFQTSNSKSETAGVKSELKQLSPREMEILRELSKGYCYQEIADHLNIGVETVRTHVPHIYEKLHVESCVEAVMKFGQNQPADSARGGKPK